MCSDLQEKNWLSRKNEFVVNKLSIIKFLNFASSRINSTCCNKKPVKQEFVILQGLSSKGVGCTMSKSTSDGVLNSLNVGLFWENYPYCLLFCSLQRDVEQFISSLQYLCVLVWLCLTVSENFQSLHFLRWLISRSSPDVLLKMTCIQDLHSWVESFRFSQKLSIVHH